MRILYPVPEYLPGESARFIQILNTCRALALGGGTVSLYAGIHRGVPQGKVLDVYGLDAPPGLNVIRLPVLRGALSWHVPFHLSFLLRAAEDPGVIFARYLKLAYFLLRNRWAHRCPVVFEAHEIFHKTTSRPGKAPALKKMEAYVYREADSVIAITASLAEEISGLFGRKADAVIPDGVGADFLDLPRHGRGTYLIYTGQLFPWKGVEILIRALSHLPGERVVIAGGSGESLDRLKRIAGDLHVDGRVEFLGTVPHAQVKKFLEEARVAVLPNLPGGVSMFTSPLKLFEYMAAGVPVVASDLPSLREVLRDGENAVLVTPGDPVALAAGIRRILDDEDFGARIALQARKEAAGYTWESRAARILEVLERVKKPERWDHSGQGAGGS